MAQLKIPPELSFLIEEREVPPTKDFKLLHSSYEADKWFIAGISKHISFDLTLDDGSKLNHKKNRVLLGQIKAWIAIQASEHIKLGGASQKRITTRILIIVGILDYLLKSQHAPVIRKYGLNAINEQIVRNLLNKITSENTTAARFYNWPTSLENHIKLLAQAQNECFNTICSDIALTDDQYKNIQKLILNDSCITIKEAIRNPAKAYKHIIDNIYENTLYGYRNFTIPVHLDFKNWEDEVAVEENIHAPVRSKHERMIKQNYSTYRSCIESLKYLEMFGYESPDDSVIEYVGEVSAKFFNLPEPDMYRSIPIEIGLLGLRNSIEFVLQYGKHLLEAFADVVEASKQEKMDLVAFVKKHGISKFIPEILQELDIRTWSKNIKQSDYPDNLLKRGLHDYVVILYGAVQIIIGTLTARRQDELMNSTCENFNREPLTFGFYVGKSGFGDTREYTERPIPEICMKLSDLVGDFQIRMASLGAVASKFFSIPRPKNISFSSVSHTNYNRAFDKVCEYFSLRCDKTKRSFNFRQHQLRRMFAQAFYWSAFGDLDVLRWFLAHTDKAHVYRYITEYIPGAVLNTIKAEFTAEFLIRGNETHSKLEDAVRARFGTSSFSLLDREEFESYLAHMFEMGQVVMEPDFLQQDNGVKLQFKYEITHA